MSNDILEKLKAAVLELDDDGVRTLVKEGLAANVAPMDMISNALSPALTVIGEGFQRGERFMSELILAGEIMNESVEELRPVMESGGQSAGEKMIIGTVEGDLHTIGKLVVGAIFTGAGYTVIDIGEDVPASKFVEAVKEHKPALVGASAILTPVKAQCKVINDALIDAGVRDDVIYMIGGWGMTQEYSEKVGADLFGKTAIDAQDKVNMIKTGKLAKFKR